MWINLPVFRGVPLLDEVVKEDVATCLVRIRVGVDMVVGVRGTDHVVVEVEADLVFLLLGQLGDVVDGTDETALLSTPPGNADLVLEACVALDGVGKLEQSSRTATVIVDACKVLDLSLY